MQKVVVYASDGNDYSRLEMATYSVKKYIGEDTSIYLLTDCNKVPKVEGINIVNPVPVLNTLGIHSIGWNRKWPFATLFRIALPLLNEFKNYNRVLYLDTDTLIRSDQAKLLFEIPMYRYEIFGAHDCYVREFHIEDLIFGDHLPPEAKKELSAKIWNPRATRVHTYINAGVSLWNIGNILANGMEWYNQRLKWFWDGITRGKMSFLDQDFINVMLDTYPCLSERFNKFGGNFKDQCAIQHFVGKTKVEMPGVAKALGFIRK